MLRRLLSLDYVLDHLDAPWLPTEQEKVAALTAAGVPEHALPGRLYVGRESTRRRHFVHKLPLALDRERADVRLRAGKDAIQNEIRTWGEAQAELWAALSAGGLRCRSGRRATGSGSPSGSEAGARRLDVQPSGR